VIDGTGRGIRNLNELEMYKGFLMANIFMTSRIAVIDVLTGKIVNYLDFTALTKEINTFMGVKNYQ
jgi:glutamine cyclotransferase